MSDITITVKSSGDKKYEISFNPSITILDLKNKIEEKSSIPSSSQRLIYSGKVLKDDQTAESYKIQNGHTIHLVKSANASTSSSSSTPAANSSTTSTTNQNQTSSQQSQPSVPSNIAAGQGSFNPLADLTGARYAGYTQLPSASMFGPDGGMNSNLPDPEQLNSMLSNPMFQEQMNSMLSNPQMLDFLIQQNPQLRSMGPQVREMMQSPMFRQMLSNPEMLRSMMQMQQGGAGAGEFGNIFGGGAGAGASSFPAPGANPTTENITNNEENNSTAQTNNSQQTTNPATNPAANPFAGLFGGMPPIDPSVLFGGAGAGAGAGAQTTPQDNRPPEERYEQQLRQLNDMGFYDFDRNVEALRRTGGSVQGAIEYLLSHV
ncbi:uncharacterized protein KGF55_004815 [Candida pseudojiufengensis]|uniref:uncharacterized protein n=1 Tax=Candida pseudojiufengensis TaxID=497109 RepID=UPI0022257C31|nr:uncharacterized protein KGF55_004815 [Candida pseudojiufengensis]KAI5960092.1 hypothetical protein KGF55_004815 [Candida pseudojiufengensis]